MAENQKEQKGKGKKRMKKSGKVYGDPIVQLD